MQEKASGYKFPTKKVIVNLAPASLRKEGPAFDLPIALAVLAASGNLPADRLRGTGVVGELSLDGGLRPIRGALSMAEGARNDGLEALILPHQNAAEAAATSGPKTYGVASLREAVRLLLGRETREPAVPSANGEAPEGDGSMGEDFADVAGQAYAKRALEVTAAGGHNILICGQNATRPRAHLRGSDWRGLARYRAGADVAPAGIGYAASAHVL